jgi:hypothetical protein
VPPITLTVALPVEFPKHSTFVWPEILAARRADGCVIVAFNEVMQPRASVIVQVHVPAGKPVAIALVCAGVVFQRKEYGVLPPMAAMATLPVELPKHSRLVWEKIDPLSGDVGSVIGTLRVVVHALASVTVTSHVPGGSPVALVPFCAGIVFHTEVYGGVPPLILMLAAPVLLPWQETSVLPVSTVVSGVVGPAMFTLAIAEQLYPSVTVAVKLPTCKLVATLTVWVGELFHE